MLTLRMDGMKKFVKGITTLEEVVRETADYRSGAIDRTLARSTSVRCSKR